MEKQLIDYLHLYLGCDIVNYPYSGLTIDEKKENPVTGKLRSVLDEKVFIMNKDKNGHNWNHLTTDSVQAVKPILRPLSMLAEPIKHNGETFIPIERLELDSHDVWYDGIVGLLKCHPHESNGWFYPLDVNDNIIRKLYEWHFDLHKLIELGLALDATKQSEQKYSK